MFDEITPETYEKMNEEFEEQGIVGYIYAWDEEAYQADNTVGWVLTT